MIGPYEFSCIRQITTANQKYKPVAFSSAFFTSQWPETTSTLIMSGLTSIGRCYVYPSNAEWKKILHKLSIHSSAIQRHRITYNKYLLKDKLNHR